MYGRSSKKQSSIKKPAYPMIIINATLKQDWAKINFEIISAKIVQHK